MGSERKFHKFADFFPMLSDDDMNILSDDISKRGLQEPIVIFGDDILDGRNRYLACKKAGIRPILKKFTGTEEEALHFVISKNLHRRHLTTSQRSMIAASISNMKVGKPPKKQKKAEKANENIPQKAVRGPDGKFISIKKAAEMMKVSPSNVKKAKKLLKESPGRAGNVMKGRETVGTAVRKTKEGREKKNPEKDAKTYGDKAVALLKKVPPKYKKAVFGRIKIWIDANINL